MEVKTAKPMRWMLAVASIVVAVAAVMFVRVGSGAAASRFSFALIGDVPYISSDVTEMGVLVSEVNSTAGIEFVAHAGDIKAGSAACSNGLITDRFNLFQRFSDPFWYTPGDNDWTDCRDSDISANPLERLSYLRSRFYPNPSRTTGGSTMAVTPQSTAYPENVRFRVECVTFGSIHQVGSSNGMSSWPNETSFEKDLRESEVANRIAANEQWVTEIFNRAVSDSSAAVFILVHAKPSASSYWGNIDNLLQQRAADFGRPVVIAHGDSHNREVETPYLGLNNVTRWETAGGSGGTKEWIRADVDCTTPGIFSQVVVPTGSYLRIDGGATANSRAQRGNQFTVDR